jgi:hypothetical protein
MFKQIFIFDTPFVSEEKNQQAQIRQELLNVSVMHVF